MKIRVIYDPVLRTKATPVTVFNDDLKNLATQMLEIMHQHNGMGLAANQLAIDKDLLVLEYIPAKDEKETKPIPKTVLCNARLLKTSKESETMVEGCLSLPGLELPVTRPSGVTVEAQDLEGKKVSIKSKGLFARILQHEIDHLNGVLFTDRAAKVKKAESYSWAKVVFFGSDDFSETIYRSLREAGLNVIAAITEADKPSGRGQKLTSPPMKLVANNDAVAVFQPETKEDITSILEQLKPDLIVLASYGKILPGEALKIPTYGSLNVHPSMLPKYRGATPIQSVILDGETETGVTIMQMNSGVDTGAIVTQAHVSIDKSDSYLSLKSRLAKIGAQLLLKTIPIYLAGHSKIRVQTDHSLSTAKLTKSLAEINWSQSAEAIDRKVRALNPWPGTFTQIKDKRLKIIDAELDGGKLKLKTVQLEGKKPCDWEDFKRGHLHQLKNCSWFGRIT